MIQFSVSGASGEVGILRCSGGMTIHVAPEVHAALLEAIEQSDKVVLNLEEVSNVDLSFLQLLCSFHRRLIKEGKILELAGNMPEPFKTAVHDAGYAWCMSEKDTAGLWRGVGN